MSRTESDFKEGMPGIIIAGLGVRLDGILSVKWVRVLRAARPRYTAFVGFASSSQLKCMISYLRSYDLAFSLISTLTYLKDCRLGH